MAKDYIPRANDAFNIFQYNIAKAVAANFTDWNIPSDDADELAAASAKYAELYRVHSRKGFRSAVDVQNYDTFRVQYEKQIRLFVNRYLRDNKLVSASALMGMGIKQRSKKRGSRSAIDKVVDLIAVAMYGCRVKFLCRIPNHEGGASMHPECDAVEIRYAIGTRPANEKECPNVFTSKKAHVFLQEDTQHAGKYLYAFARWVNQSNDKLSGGYGAMATVMLH